MAESTTGISELLKHLKNEGVDAGEAERLRITKKANEEAAYIIENAKKQALEILEAAKKERDTQKDLMTTELKMASRDFVIGFSEKFKTNFALPLIKEKVEKTLDEGFLATLIEKIINNYVNNSNAPIEISVSSETKKQLEIFFKNQIAGELQNKEFWISAANNIKGFKITKKENNCTFDFTADTIANELFSLIGGSFLPYFPEKIIKN